MELRRYKSVNDERTDWAVIGDLGAVHFWMFNHHRHLGGVEEHRKEPSDHQRGDQPSQEKCFLLDCACWHDGSALYADKFFPILELDGEDAVYAQLEREYQTRFENT